MKNLLLTTAIIFLGITYSSARKITSKVNGGFTASSSWNSSFTPAAGDTITINSGHKITVSSNLTYSGTAIMIIVEGEFNFNGGGSKITLPSGSTIVIKSGGSLTTSGSGAGNSQTVKIGSNVVWTKSDGNQSGPYNFDQSGGYTPLPVTLLSFNVASVSNSVLITWSTSNEINNQYYTIEKSINGAAYEKVTDLYTNFNSTGVTNYNYTDKEVSSNVVYRLSQTDMDTKLTYLASKGIQSNKKAISFNVWPNPATCGVLNINIPQSDEIYTIELYTLTGEKVYTAQMTSMNTELTLGSDMAKGIYILMLKSASGQTSNTKLMIQ
ncbi:MAG: T9SS type A sorting domain-containing protein [Bacteroidetes bacterium]|nr:T9SS type A sorting domain-containing protein [Bacteroidota bacterium]